MLKRHNFGNTAVVIIFKIRKLNYIIRKRKDVQIWRSHAKSSCNQERPNALEEKTLWKIAIIHPGRAPLHREVPKRPVLKFLPENDMLPSSKKWGKFVLPAERILKCLQTIWVGTPYLIVFGNNLHRHYRFLFILRTTMKTGETKASRTKTSSIK